VAPLARRRQHLAVARREADGVRWHELEEVRFVPLIRGG
jgi:hypothetical protein